MAAIEGAVSGIFGLANTVLNNELIGARTSQDRAENYLYGERAANNADKRTRALYADFYSPEALMNQYKDAGLSPSLMFGGTPGQGGMSGAQGTGAAGPQTPYMPFSILEAAQAAQLFAQTEKTKEETKNIAADTELKELQEQWQNMQNTLFGDEYRILQTGYMENGENLSLYDIANKFSNYEDFLKHMQTEHYVGHKTKEENILRQTYYEANKFETDIAILSSDKVSADFSKKVLQVLDKKGFANENAETALKQLKAAGEAADLTTEQKGAWNHIIGKLEKTNSTMADILIIASMIFNQAASHWVSTSVKLGGK